MPELSILDRTSESAELVSMCDGDERGCLESILAERTLDAVFQPIVSTRPGAVLGYEGLVRGPMDSPLHDPVNLFRSAREHGLTFELEYLCCRTLLERFCELRLPGKLFLNISPAVLIRSAREGAGLDGLLANSGFAPDRVVFELTEQRASADDRPLQAAIARYRAVGIQVAIDDLGEGFSSLRRWFELRPEYIKIDRFFIRDIDTDPVKQQFVRSICDIAHMSNGLVVAEGVETRSELQYLVDHGINCCQGYYIDRPQRIPASGLAEGVSRLLARKEPVSSDRPAPATVQESGSAYRLLRSVPIASPDMTNSEVGEIFVGCPDLHTIPVVADGVPLGVITRTGLIDRFARPYQRELFGKKPCSILMDDKPPIVNEDTSLQALSHILVEAHSHRLANDFIITDHHGRYLGIGTSHDLLRALTELQISTAKYANPLTQLPGNVSIDQHIEHLLDTEVEFCACYADLDYFKPFNDVFGYKRGDDLIQLVGQVLGAFIDQDRDFLGHIGGDDFLILFRSEDWEDRCRKILDAFSQSVTDMICDAESVMAQGYYAEDRQGNQQFYALPSLSLGAVVVLPSQYTSHHQVAQTAATAKSQAKKVKGNSLFVERRRSTENVC